MRKSDNPGEDFEVKEKKVKTEEIIGEKIFARRFVNTVKKIIKLNKVRKVLEDFAQGKRQIEMTDEFKMMLPILKAMNYLYSALSNKQMELINDEDTSYKAIKKLDKLYLCKSTALQISVRNKLDRLRLRDFTETSEFEKLIIELKNASATVNETESLNYLKNLEIFLWK